MRSKLTIAAIITVLSIALCFGGALGVKWIMMPKGPDLASASDKDLRKFMASDDFNKLFQYQRQRYLQAYIDRQKEKSFGELIKVMMQNFNDRDSSRAFMKNLQQIDNHDEIPAQMVDPVLDKFYEQDEAMRQRQLYMMAMFQQSAIAKRPEVFGLPTVDQFKGEMVRVMTNQPSTTQNKIAQFMLDMRSTRRQYNMADPY